MRYLLIAPWVCLAAFTIPVGCGKPESTADQPAVEASKDLSLTSKATANAPAPMMPAALELKPLPEPEGTEGNFSIKQVMQLAHQNKLYRQATSDAPSPIATERLLILYQALPTQPSPNGDADDWKKRSTALVEATQMIIDGQPESSEAFRRAVNCNSCHSRHKP